MKAREVVRGLKVGAAVLICEHRTEVFLEPANTSYLDKTPTPFGHPHEAVCHPNARDGMMATSVSEAVNHILLHIKTYCDWFENDTLP